MLIRVSSGEPSLAERAENGQLQNFHCVAKFERRQRRAAGVATYKNDKDTTNIVNSQMDAVVVFTRSNNITT
jgi:hypothetical protein